MIEWVDERRIRSNFGTQEISEGLSLEAMHVPHLRVRTDCRYCTFTSLRVISLSSDRGHTIYECFNQSALRNIIRLQKAIIETWAHLDVNLGVTARAATRIRAPSS